MPNRLQNFIDNLDETDRREVDRLKAQFLADEAACKPRYAAPTPDTATSRTPLTASPSKHQ